MSNSVWGDAGLGREESEVGTLEKGCGGPCVPGWRLVLEALRTTEEQCRQCCRLIRDGKGG